MAKITTDFAGTETATVVKSRLTSIIQQWLGSTALSSATTWGNVRTLLNTMADTSNKISNGELASSFRTKLNWLNEYDNAIYPLFANSEQGVWYDPSDLTTMYQDNTGSTPVTTAGQTVAFIIDKSQGLTLGSELAISPVFTAATANGTVSTAGDVLTSTCTVNGTYGLRIAALSAVIGKVYRITVEVLSNSASKNCYSDFGGRSVNFGTTTGTKTSHFIGTSSTANLSIYIVGGVVGETFSVRVSTLSVRELFGTHATQSTPASRPTYGVVPATGRRNLLINTPFDGAVSGTPGTAPTSWAALLSGGTITASTDKVRVQTTAQRHILQQFVSVSANTTYTFSVSANVTTSARVDNYVGVGGLPTGAVVDTYLLDGVAVAGTQLTGTGTKVLGVRFIISATAGSPAVRIGSGLLANSDGNAEFTTPQLETGTSITAYQRVVSSFDVTEAGVASLSYLSFDGIDDFLVSSTITPNTDKVQVFAGVRALSFSAENAIIEFGAAATSGEFRLVTLPSSTYRFSSRGTAFVGASGAGYTAPTQNTLSGLGDISGDLATLRVNSTQVAQSTADQGTGNYLAYPLYIGRRGGTTLPFNGQLYNMIVRFGANLTTSRLTQTERFVGSKTGVTL